MLSLSPFKSHGEAAELGYLVTKITDNGKGISSSAMKSLFTTFKQKTRRGILGKEGIGIGLSTAKALTTSLGGAICVQSCKNMGTGVTFSIQMRSQEQKLAPKQLKIELTNQINEMR